MRKTIIRLAVAALSLTAIAQADTNFAAQVSTLLDTAGKSLAEQGYARAGADVSASLRLNSGKVWSFPVRAGVNYVAVGVCDTDCDDMDIEIYGVDGIAIARDVLDDDVPIVKWTAAATGIACARAWVAKCDSEPCFVGARVMVKSQQ